MGAKTVKSIPAQVKKLKAEAAKPWPEPVDGSALFDDIAACFRRHLYLPKGAAEAMALWVPFTQTFDAWEINPYLLFTSEGAGHGKSKAEDMLEFLTRRSVRVSHMSPAFVYRYIEKFQPTLLIDEADTFFQDNPKLRGILNSGHTPLSAFVGLNEGNEKANGWTPELFSTWSPMVIAGIRKGGWLTNTLRSRSIEIKMQEAPAGSISPFRVKDWPELVPLAQRVVRWGQDNIAALAEADPVVPAGMHNRRAEKWRPMLAIADAADGPWPELARAAAMALDGRVDDTVVEAGREVFRVRKAKRLSSEELCKAMPWFDPTAAMEGQQARLADLLRPHGITPITVRPDGSDKAMKGYKVESFVNDNRAAALDVTV